MKIRSVVLTWMLALCIAPAFAEQDKTRSLSPDQVVIQTSNEVAKAIDPNVETLRNDPAKLYKIVNDIILPRFDFPYMSQLVLGKYWRSATAAQKTRFTAAFRDMMVRTYSNALLEYSGTAIKYQPMHLEPNAKEVDQRAEVKLPSGQIVSMTYSLHKVASEWKVYNISIDAISLVTNYRGVFAGQIKKSGLDSLIERLEAKNAGAARG